MKAFFIIYKPLMIASAPKEITQRQPLVNTVVNFA
jgi:hypothetical protein